MLYATPPNVLAITYGWTQYENLGLQERQNFLIQNTGLHINAEFPYPEASRDGLIQYDCHAKDVLEIKRPHNYRYGLKNWQQHKTSLLMKSIKLKLTTNTIIKFKARCLY